MPVKKSKSNQAIKGRAQAGKPKPKRSLPIICSRTKMMGPVAPSSVLFDALPKTLIPEPPPPKPSHLDIINQIDGKMKRLHASGEQLKKHFVGLDSIIDSIIRNLEAWYCMPDLLTRPTILCLWGLTGVGKTDLVRRLVPMLDMSDNFVEVQMTNQGSSKDTYCSTIESLLTMSSISVHQPGILLLDEIQRFRTISENGTSNDGARFQDLWALLSDGNFGGKSSLKDALTEMMMETAYNDDYLSAKQAYDEELERSRKSKKKKATDSDWDEWDREREGIKQLRKYKQSYHRASELKSRLMLKEEIDEIMQWSSDKTMDMIKSRMDDKSIYEVQTYKKLLIIISGNLDEAYSIANATGEVDLDADLFHEYSKRINLLQIKNALRERFAPEQIARFGNNHVVYPSLSRNDYEVIIRRKVETVLEELKMDSGVDFKMHSSIYDAIYRNGVFPVQGTRPVFSTISGMLETTLPFFLLAALRANQKEVTLRYRDKHVEAKIGGKTVRIKNEGEIDRIRSKTSVDMKRLVATHEAGHAVAYAVLFGVAPLQMVISTAGDDKEGFVAHHPIFESKDFIEKQIMVQLAGRAAEEVLLGKENICKGNIGDLMSATSLATDMIRRSQMGRYKSFISSNYDDRGPQANTGIDKTNPDVERLLSNKTAQAKNLIKKHKKLVVAVADALCSLQEHERLWPTDFKSIAEKHGIQVDVKDAKHMIYPPYAASAASTKSRPRKKAGKRC